MLTTIKRADNPELFAAAVRWTGKFGGLRDVMTISTEALEAVRAHMAANPPKPTPEDLVQIAVPDLQEHISRAISQASDRYWWARRDIACACVGKMDPAHPECACRMMAARAEGAAVMEVLRARGLVAEVGHCADPDADGYGVPA
jgi:hypothetical protein